MFNLCKNCSNRCKIVSYDTKTVIAPNMCFITLDACVEERPIQVDTNGVEICDYFEPKRFRFSKK